MAIFRKLPGGRSARISNEGGIYTASVTVPYRDDPERGSVYEVQGSSEAEVWRTLKEVMALATPPEYSPERAGHRVQGAQRTTETAEAQCKRLVQEVRQAAAVEQQERQGLEARRQAARQAQRSFLVQEQQRKAEAQRERDEREAEGRRKRTEYAQARAVEEQRKRERWADQRKNAAQYQRLGGEVLGEFLNAPRYGWKVRVRQEAEQYRVQLAIPSPGVFSTTAKEYTVSGADVQALRSALRREVEADPPPYLVPRPPDVRAALPAYITNFRARQILKGVMDADNLKRMGMPAPSAYKAGADAGVFSHGELVRLAATKALFEDFELFITHLYNRASQPELAIDEVGSVSHATFHLHPDCGRALSDYEGWEIPVEVIGRGDGEVARFRRWYHDNAQLAEENPERFMLHAVFTFRLTNNPQIIVRKNSGVAYVQNHDLSILESEIDGLLADAQERLRTSHAIQGRGHRAHEKSLQADEEFGQELREWSELKNHIKNKLRTYYQVRFNPQLQFDGSLLEQLGFRPCSTCAAGWGTEEASV